MNRLNHLALILAAFIALVIGFASPAAAEKLDCLECHDALTAGSVHEENAECVECHEDVRDETHEDGGVKPVDCGLCHEELAEHLGRDIHQRLNERVGDDGPNCVSCHGDHEIKTPRESKDPVADYCSDCHDNVMLVNPYHSLGSVPDETCLECHENAEGFPDHLATSVHREQGCSDCHAYSALHLEQHQDELPFDQVADCFLCHRKESVEHHDSIHGISVAKGVGEAANCWNCHGSHAIGPVKVSDSPVHPSNLSKTCGSCHDDPKFTAEFVMSVKLPGNSFAQSVHGKLVEHGRMEAANCVLCHGTHDIKNRIQPGSPISPFQVPQTCGQCHGDITAAYQRSIHWVQAKRGVRDAPVCNNCHSEHSIQRIDVVSKNGAHARRIQEETCLRCHADPIIARRYNLNPGRAASYRDSYHGMAEKRGDGKVAMCVDCHGVHDILPQSHPASLVNESNVVETCRKCHPDANESFAHSYTHEAATPINRRLVYWVEVIYIWMIWLVIGAMLLHNGLLFARELRVRWRRTSGEISIPRFSRHEVVQHLLLVTSFLVLVVTGFALTFPESWWFKWLEWLQMTETMRQYVHRTAGVVLIVLGCHHVAYLISTRRGRHIAAALWLRFEDAKAAFQNVAYHLGLRSEKPDFSEFDYTEKAEYWALLWGTVVMALTGIILWFPEDVSRFAPAWIIELSTVVHFYEAVLASLAILVWHGFFVMLHPREYPLSFTMVNGRMSLEHYAHHHRLPFKRLLLEWMRIKTGRWGRSDVSYYTERLLSALEQAGHNPDFVLQDYLDRDPELRAWVEQHLPLP